MIPYNRIPKNVCNRVSSHFYAFFLRDCTCRGVNGYLKVSFRLFFFLSQAYKPGGMPFCLGAELLEGCQSRGQHLVADSLCHDITQYAAHYIISYAQNRYETVLDILS